MLFIEFQSSLMKVKEWLARTEGALQTIEELPVQQQLTDLQREKVKVMNRNLFSMILLEYPMYLNS